MLLRIATLRVLPELRRTAHKPASWPASNAPQLGYILARLRHGIDTVGVLHRRINEAPAKRRVLDRLSSIKGRYSFAQDKRGRQGAANGRKLRTPSVLGAYHIEMQP